jgi:anthranilate phosphoribosyltransferase
MTNSFGTRTAMHLASLLTNPNLAPLELAGVSYSL